MRLEISYNLLNLPSEIYGWGDYSDYYEYLSDGTKMGVASYAEDYPVRYAGSLVYDDGAFESASFGGGRIVSTNNGSEVHYFLTDHLGSTRVVAKVTPTGRIDLDRKDYYPFGKEWAQPDMPTSDNRYTFSGKERQDIESDDCVTTSLHDFGARFYDSDGVTFIQQDPLLEKYFHIGSYNYCEGNPVKNIDIDGKDIYNLTRLGFIILQERTNDNTDKIISLPNAEGYSNSLTVDKSFMGSEILETQVDNIVDLGVYTTAEYELHDAIQLKNIFEFMAQNTDVEWAMIETLKSDGNKGYALTTSHKQNKEQGTKAYLRRTGENLIKHTHNHPKGSKASKEDKKSAAKFPNATFLIYRAENSTAGTMWEYLMYQAEQNNTNAMINSQRDE